MIPHLLAAASEAPLGTMVLVVIVGTIVIAIVVQIAKGNAAAQKEAAVKARTDFRADAVYVSPLDQNGLAIETAGARLLLVRGDHQQVLSASEVLSVEVLVNDTSLVRTNRGSQVAGAAVGGLLLGPVGLLLGGLTGSTRSETRVRRIVLRIVTTDFAKPNHDILLYKSASAKGDRRDSWQLKAPMKTAETWHSRVAALIRQGEAKPSPVPESVGLPTVADELRKLHELKRDGILTDEEFGEQKRRLLSGTGPVA